MRELILEAGRAERHYWRDLWHYRELFYTLAWRDLAVRYKQTAIGVSWALIRPLLTMVVFTVVFGKLAKLPAPDGVPYALLVFAAMLPWQFVATGVSGRENIFLNGAILGMTRSEIRARFDEIVAFAEVEQFLSTPRSSATAAECMSGWRSRSRRTWIRRS